MDVEDAEQVVDAVVERVRVTLKVEEQVTGVRVGHDRQAALGLDGLAGRRQQELVDRLRQPSTRDLDTGLFAHALQAGSEEHTSELQSHSDLVCRLLLEK